MNTGFTIIEKIHQSQRTEIFRAIRKSDQLPVILKVRGELIFNERETGLFHEHELGQTLRGEYSVKHLGIEQDDANLILILQDDMMTSLDSVIPAKGFELLQFLKISIAIVSAIEEIHSQGVIHKDINPANIIIDSEYENVKVIDFGLATRISEEVINFEPPSVMQGNLFYISPEQTGRINKPIDARTDLYSLGITLYQLITGKLPFDATNPGKLIYSHIAKNPVSACEIRPDIPQVISLVIEKLLMKSPNERYQTATGVKSDFLYLQNAISMDEKAIVFKPGKNEYSSKIVFSGKLYGRENETNLLLNCFSKCRELGQLVTVSGNPGIGKTALIRELYTPVTTSNGFFLSGKFDQLNTGQAYAAFADALKDFVPQCLELDEKSIEFWKNIIQSSVGVFGQVVVDIVPEFSRLIEDHQMIAPISPLETVARRNNVFLNLIKDICSVGYPLVIFIDDLQWADSATLSLIEKIIEIEQKHLMIILSFRENELSPIHPANLFLENINSVGFEITDISLENLTEENVSSWVNDILSGEGGAESDLLVKQLIVQTEANPFYLISLMQLIVEKNLIKRQKDGKVVFDVEGISNIPIDSDVVDHIIRKIENLNKQEKEFLIQVSVLGSCFSLENIKLYLGKEYAEFQNILQNLIETHLLVKSNELIMFTHDRVQQAVRMLLDNENASAFHLQAGKNIRAALMSRGLANERIEDYIHHFNAASDLIVDLNERLALARINTMLGKRLKNNAACDAAEIFFSKAVDFISPEAFSKDYDLATDLYTEYGETLFLNLKYEEGEKQFLAVLSHSKSPLDKAKVFVKQINHYAAHHNLDKSMQIAIYALSTVGLRLPDKLLKIKIIIDLLNVKHLLRKIKTEDILTFSETSDSNVLAQMELLSAAAVPAYIGFPDYYPIIIFKMMKITILKGLSAISSFALVNYAVILCTLGSANAGYSYGKTALEMMVRFDTKQLYSKVSYLFGLFVHHWKASSQDSIEYFETAIANGLTSGDYEFASYAANDIIPVSFYSGKSIETLLRQYPKQHKILAGFGKDHAIAQAKFFHQFLVAINDVSGDGVTIAGEIIDEKDLIHLLDERKDLSSLAFCMVGKLQLTYLAGDYQRAYEVKLKVMKLLKSITGTMDSTVCVFFAALTSIAYYRKYKKSASHLRDASRLLNQLKKWAVNSPDNYLHKAQLVEAELMSVKGKQALALKFYERAIKNAEKAGNNMDLGIAFECMGRYLLSAGFDSIGLMQIHHSIEVFYNWGAFNKSTRLSREFNIVINRDLNVSRSTSSEHSFREINTQLDLEALAGTIQSLTGELNLDLLLTTLLDVVMQRSGATRAVYVHVDEGELLVKAEKRINGVVEITNGGDSNPESYDVPDDLLKKCLIGSNGYVLDNIKVGLSYQEGEHQDTRLMSVLIIPLIRDKSVKGMVYLENDLMGDAFRVEHIKLVSLLAGQATIAIENALVFEALQHSEEKLRLLATNLPSVMIYQVILKPDGSRQFIYVSDNVKSINKVSAEAVLADSNVLYSQILPERLPDMLEKENSALLNMKTFKYETQMILPDNEIRWFQLISTPQVLPDGSVAWDGVEIDITDSKIAEEKLRQSQKMDAIGQLAGGMAHDFNNMLAGIMGAAQMLKIKEKNALGNGEEYVDMIIQASTRASDLISKLLSFGRKGKIGSKNINIHNIIDDSCAILNSTIDKKIEISADKNAENFTVIGDDSELQNAIMNICINASQAMPEGGTIQINSNNIQLNKIYCDASLFEIDPGEYVEIVIRDTGSGIPLENIHKIFQPFYTTKEQGTGLGLSAVYGTVQKHHGAIVVYSDIEKGTSFHVMLPCSEVNIDLEKTYNEIIPGTGLILLVDDEEIIRNTGKSLLEEIGYDVLLAKNGQEAVDIFQEKRDEIDLIVMDMIMPVMNGHETFFQLREIDENCKIIISSGFVKSENLVELREKGLAGLINKPYRSHELSQLLAEVLKR